MPPSVSKIETRINRQITPQVRWALLLTLASTLVFAQAVNFEFQYLDDDLNVFNNKLVTQFSLAKLKLIWGQPYQGLYIPLTYTVWGGLGRIAAWLHPSTNPTALTPAVFHAANIILHTITILVVFTILRLLIGKNWPAAFGALLFGLHPVQVGPVAWVSGMKQVLSGLLGMLALWQYLLYARSDAAPPRQRHLHYLYATGLFLAALLCLPGKANVPLIAAALSCILLNRPWRKAALELTPWLLLVLPIFLITKGLQPSSSLTFTPNLWQRILVAGDSITFYHFKLLWPYNLAFDYGRDPESVLSTGYIYLSGLLPYLMWILLIWRCRDRWLLATALAFVAALSPTLGFVSFQFQEISTVANRYLYFAMLAPALLGGHLLHKHPGRVANACAVTLIMLLALRSSSHIQYWQNPVTFNQHAIAVNPESDLAYNNLGVAYKHNGQIPEATAAFMMAIKLNPASAAPYVNLGNIYTEQGLTDDAKTMYLKGLELNPYSAKLYMKLAVLASRSGQPDQALTYFSKAVEIRPEFARAYVFGGWLYNELGQKDAAIENYRRALQINPYLGEAHNNLGLLYEESHRKNEAIEAYRQAMRLLPDQYDAFNNLGALYLEDNRTEEAIALLRQAANLAPEQVNPYRNLGIAYLKLGQTQEAAKWFAQARVNNPNFADASKNLAAIRLMAAGDNASEFAQDEKEDQ